MKFLLAYIRNLLLMALVIGGMLVFTRIFYPSALDIFVLMGKAYSILKLWPFLILALLVAALPRRRR